MATSELQCVLPPNSRDTYALKPKRKMTVEEEMRGSPLAYQCDEIIDAMICVDDAEWCPLLDLHGKASSLGRLECLPPEVLMMILDQLDIMSVVHLALVTRRSNSLLSSHRMYRELMTHAPDVFVALVEMGLAEHVALIQLVAAFRDERCVICAQFGPFLFLPTCERCCWHCLVHHPSLRVITPLEARRTFGLTKRDIQRLPVFQSIPGDYGIDGEWHNGKTDLLSVKAAKRLALEIHGSQERLTRTMIRRCKAAGPISLGHFLHRDTMLAPSDRTFHWSYYGNVIQDDNLGIASMPFPSLSASGEIQYGHWCRGCDELYAKFFCSMDLVSWERIAGLVPKGCDAHLIMLGWMRKAWSAGALKKHADQCYGIELLRSENEID